MNCRLVKQLFYRVTLHTSLAGILDNLTGILDILLVKLDKRNLCLKIMWIFYILCTARVPLRSSEDQLQLLMKVLYGRPQKLNICVNFKY